VRIAPDAAVRVATVEKERLAASIQKTQPAGTAPVRPASFGAGYTPSKRTASAGESKWNWMAIGGANGRSAALSLSLSAGKSASRSDAMVGRAPEERWLWLRRL